MADRLALIIANSDFEDEKLCRLKTPIRDAEALAAVLDDPDIGDFDVTLLIDEPEPLVRRRIARLYHRRKRSDLLLLYYSGHGIRDAHGDLYLATRDTEMDIAGATALSASFVRGQIDRSNSRRKVVVLDCCHSGAFAGAKSALGDSVGTEDAFAGSGYGRVILTASDALELSWEGDEWLGEGRPSVFTNFLVEGLRTGKADLDGDGKIVLDELYKYVYERVMTSGYAKQTPHRWAQQVEGQIVVARSPRLPSRTTGLPPDLQRAVESPVSWMREGAVSGLERLMRGREGEMARTAREALERLAGDENPRVAAAAARALGIGEKSPKEEPAPQSPPPTIEKPERLDALTITAPIHLELVRVPAGEFLMGSDPAKDEDAYDEEQPQHTIDLPEFAIGKYPVTNAQYAAFVQATGHRAPKHWEKGEVPSGKGDHPVVYVSWHDAMAFCEWLSQETGREFVLPSEAEWEKAARGTDGRIYPWGDEGPTTDLCNFSGNVGDTTPAGNYSPAGDSPYGCADMAGNVWEWTRSLWGEDWQEPDSDYPYDSEDGREDLEAGDDARRVLRGGAFNYDARLVRCAFRYLRRPHLRDDNYGFRVVVSPFSRTQ
jgi:formylglycine-generating enzyme required for sulfatase activity